MSEFDEKSASVVDSIRDNERIDREYDIIEGYISAGLRKMDLVGLLATKELLSRASASIAQDLRDLQKQELVHSGWRVSVKLNDTALQVVLHPPIGYIQVQFRVTE